MIILLIALSRGYYACSLVHYSLSPNRDQDLVIQRAIQEEFRRSFELVIGLKQ